MDFFERVFQVSPDGGSGLLEAVYWVFGVAFVASLIFRRRLRRFIRETPRSPRGMRR
jgi:hypothetical protein